MPELPSHDALARIAAQQTDPQARLMILLAAATPQGARTRQILEARVTPEGDVEVPEGERLTGPFTELRDQLGEQNARAVRQAGKRAVLADAMDRLTDGGRRPLPGGLRKPPGEHGGTGRNR
ncbi:hypothetical protein [Streptomyces sp. NPDC058861]|uniref:hypothetical protein n=1 Tax=Streptomyces sp. NPDC058861 TaxID=3346653 RepID=UPI003674DCD5